MNEVTMPVEQVRALLLCAAKKDIRHYLNGVLFDLDNHRAVSTDGRLMLLVNITVIDPSPGQVIVPRDALENLVKGGKKTDTVMFTFDSKSVTAQRGSVQSTCEPIDGKFPDYEKVCPKECGGETTQFDPALLATVGKAVLMASDAPADAIPAVAHNGLSAAVVAANGYEHRTIGLIMPCRVNPIDIELFWKREVDHA